MSRGFALLHFPYPFITGSSLLGLPIHLWLNTLTPNSSPQPRKLPSRPQARHRKETILSDTSTIVLHGLWYTTTILIPCLLGSVFRFLGLPFLRALGAFYLYILCNVLACTFPCLYKTVLRPLQLYRVFDSFFLHISFPCPWFLLTG